MDGVVSCRSSGCDRGWVCTGCGPEGRQSQEVGHGETVIRARGGKEPGRIVGAGGESQVTAAPRGLKKAAILMVLLGEDAASEIFHHLQQGEVERITQEIGGLDQVNPETALVVLEEFHRLVLTGDYISKGGTEYANKLLVKAFGKEGASELLRQGSGAAEMSGGRLDSLRKADPQLVAKFIEGEHSQTISLILAHGESKQAPHGL